MKDMIFHKIVGNGSTNWKNLQKNDIMSMKVLSHYEIILWMKYGRRDFVK